MALDLEKLIVSLVADRTGFSSSLRASEGEARTWSNIVTGIFQGVGQQITRFAAGAVRFVVGEFNRSIDAASSLNESVNRTGVVFRDSAQEVLAWSKTTADAFGISRREALASAGDFGNLFTTIGLATDAAAGMSTQMIELGADLASFNDLQGGTTEGLQILRSLLSGESEPGRRVGIFLNEAIVNAKALEMGLAETTKQITEADKVQARYALILQQTANAQDDFANTADSAANAQRRFNAQIENYRTMFGQVFLPFRAQTLGILADVLQNMAPYAENIMDQFALGLARGIVAITPVLVQLKDLFTFWLKPGSPPRLLPDLTKWGIGAANAWLEGWTQADFGIFSGVANTVRGLLSSMVAGGRMPEGGLFSALMGSRSALAGAVAEFAATGTVAESTFAKIRESAGSAGQSVEALTRAYFQLEQASRATEQAQSELTAIQERYNQALNPITGELGDIAARRQEIQDRQRIDELKRTLATRNATGDEKELAMLELRAIELRRQQSALEDERDTAVNAAQAKLDAAKEAEQQAAAAYAMQQENIRQEEAYNQLLADRERFLEQTAAAAKRAYDEQARKVEEAIRKDRQLYNAQLQYNLAVADTAGQIAIWEEELTKFNPTQVEYWQILTQITTLQERLKDSGGTGGLDGLGAAGSGAVEGLTEASEGVNALVDAIEGMFKALDLLPENTNPAFKETTENLHRILTDSRTETKTEADGMMGDIKTAIDEGKGPVDFAWDLFWNGLYATTKAAAEKETDEVETMINNFTLKVIENRGDFRTAWEETWAEIEAANEAGGTNAVAAFWFGFQTKWNEFAAWWGPQFAWLGRDLAAAAAVLGGDLGGGGGFGSGGGSGGFGGGTSRSAPVLAPASNTTINYAPIINVGPGTDPVTVGSEVRKAGDDFITEWRKRGNP